jgi:peptidoglycan hydrolase-like protein with peptidoglycan-binding domain
VWPSAAPRGTFLTSRDYATTADGGYGSGTEAAVTSFQSATGLSADGVAGPATFGARVSTLRQGSTGAAVQAAQAVQRSCRPDAYAKWESLARDIVAHESGAPPVS